MFIKERGAGGGARRRTYAIVDWSCSDVTVVCIRKIGYIVAIRSVELSPEDLLSMWNVPEEEDDEREGQDLPGEIHEEHNQLGRGWHVLHRKHIQSHTPSHC